TGCVGHEDREYAVAAVGAAVDREAGRARSDDRHRAGDLDLSRSQGDGTCQPGLEIDDVRAWRSTVGARDRGAQTAWAAVAKIGDSERRWWNPHRRDRESLRRLRRASVVCVACLICSNRAGTGSDESHQGKVDAARGTD